MLTRMFKSIKTTLAITAVAFTLLSSLMIMWLAVEEHESLYLQSTTADLRALTSNISVDLLPAVGNSKGSEQLTSILTRFEPYANVMFASVYDENFNFIERYIGRAGRQQKATVEAIGDGLSELPLGEYKLGGFLFSVKRIGQAGYLRGFLVVVNDLHKPLSRSKYQFIVSVLPFTFVSIIILSLLYLWSLKAQIAPLVNLSDFTHKLQFTKDYSLRHQTEGHNEVSQLGDNINGMIATIENELIINREQTARLIEQQRTMTQLANYDSLTGLPNRQFVMDTLKLELSRALRADQDLVLMFFDLDGFKSVNDSLGHETGDKVLIDVAERVSALMRDGDLVARLGGDEFLIVPARGADEDTIQRMATRLISAFQAPFYHNGLDLYVGVSIGISKATDANFKLNDLVSNADIAMYRSKKAGKGCFTVFNESMIEDHRRKLMIANSINAAISQDEFRVHYQVKVSLTGEIVGFETLLRWAHPVLGMVSPTEFIPIAEQGGKIPAITSWVLEQACKDLSTIRSMFAQKFRVSVNLSAFDLRNPALFDFIHNLFERYSVDPRYFELEVTESAYLESFKASDKFFRRINNMGCAISLDDFGTGYSSLGYLTQISIDTLKIDRQFVQELETSERSRMVTGTIIDLAKRLNLTICAEGIENPKQIEYLHSQGCDHLQGFYFSEPVPLAQLSDLPSRFEITKGIFDADQLAMEYS